MDFCILKGIDREAMVDFLHYDFFLSFRDSVQVQLDSQANVILLDDLNFENYKNSRQYTYYGGLATRTPVYLKPPFPGHWHLVIDLGGGSGSVNASVSVIRKGY